MAIEIEFKDFEKFVEFMIGCNQRFSCPENFALAFIRPEFKEEYEKLKEVVKEVLRNTDIFCEIDNNLFVILTGTDKKGADFISKAIYEFFNKSVVEVYVDFPEDGKSAEELLKSLETAVENKYGFLIGKYFRK